MLKIRGLLPPHQQLSIEELVQQMRFYFPHEVFPPVYGIRDLLLAEFILKSHGLVAEEMNPLYYNFESTEEIPLPKEYASPTQKYYIEKMELVRAVDFESYEKFEASLVKDLHKCPLACSVKLYPSFNDITGKQLYDPTVNEVRQQGLHSMLLVARGRNEKAKHFLEFQDSYGTDVGDDGFVRVRMGNDLNTHYVRFTL
uniref:Peptidase C1A papain C-terminal domain-containing protein n=1 Tax=Noccaea caerulescens TaxID=107243 RepID=A0A1J3IC96_NOCCA